MDTKKRVALVLSWLGMILGLSAQDFTVMTYNIRVAFPDTSWQSWDYRRDNVATVISHHGPDILGLQEAKKTQVDFLMHRMPGYAMWGVGRDDGEMQGEYCAIIYRSERYEILEKGNFWLSPTPDSVSVGWDASFPRICTYALFRDLESNDTLFVLNTHFDHMGILARRHSAELILERIDGLIAEHPHPVVFMGDLNATPGSKPISTISGRLRNADAENFGNQEPTFNGFTAGVEDDKVIDFIFHSSDIRVLEGLEVDTSTVDGRYPSDHFPVSVKLGFGE